jgi:hypothetical protein
VPEPKAGTNRAHFDVAVPDEGEAVQRLAGLGARVVWREDFRTHHRTVLADPEGNEFCVRGSAGDSGGSATRSRPSAGHLAGRRRRMTQ